MRNGTAGTEPVPANYPAIRHRTQAETCGRKGDRMKMTKRHSRKYRKITGIALCAAMTAGLLSGCGGTGTENGGNIGTPGGESGVPGAAAESGDSSSSGGAAAAGEGTAKDSVVVVMGPTSEPESGFDPAYG